VTMPFGYVSPEQLMKDRADYARKGIARGRSVVVLAYDDGILFVAENLSRALHKISEIYDRIAFAAVGKYNEFENLRIAGVRLADLRGYSYDRRDVTGRQLANAYAQTLGTIFTQESKPYEVEIVVAEVGETPDEDQIYRLTYDGSVADEHGFVAMGGQAEQISQALDERWRAGLSLTEAVALAVELLGRDPTSGDQRTLTASQLEVAVLERARPRRKFRRLSAQAMSRLLGQEAGPGNGDAGPEAARATPAPDERDSSPPTSLAGGSHEPPGPSSDGAPDPGSGEGGSDGPTDQA
jgi:proteasome alpha subunit